MKKTGFTLAEVLITLGIIGVVAAMTIPILMSQIQDLQLKTAAKGAYSKASQALHMMKLDEGGSLTGYYGTNDSKFKNAFMGYFKVIQDSDGSGLIPATSSSNIYTSLHGNKADTRMFARGQFITTDGLFWGIGTNIASYILIGVDVNGYTKGPNVYGRDFFFLELKNDILMPEGAINSNYYNSSSWYCDKQSNDTAAGAGCMYNVIKGIDYAY